MVLIIIAFINNMIKNIDQVDECEPVDARIVFL